MSLLICFSILQKGISHFLNTSINVCKTISNFERINTIFVIRTNYFYPYMSIFYIDILVLVFMPI